MKKHPFLLLFLLLVITAPSFAQTIGLGSRMNEVFERTDLASGPTRLYDPWEITYGPDGHLWITEARTYKVYRMDPNTGTKTTVLDLGNTSGFTPASFKRTFSISQNPWPQGGMAGLAIHPDFMNTSTPKKYVYVSYVRSYDSTSVTTNGGVFFTNRIVRFTYNTGTGQLENPVSLCDTLPGSNDHNSQRMIIAPVNGTYYLFYAQGDMGAGQFSNLVRANKAQDSLSYQGKILRFNLEDDGDAGTLDKWIPNDNPFNTISPARQSAVWSTGIRNNQGFAYDSVRNILYGASHGPFSDDEINIIEGSRNYGHPRVIGYSYDHNYDSAKAGPSNSSLPFIYNEAKYASDTIGPDYRDPIYSFYPAPKGNVQTPWTQTWSIQYIYSNQTYTGGPTGSAQNLNQFWASEAVSGLGLYNYSMIPGWKNSLLAAALKGGKIERLKLSADGMSVVKTAPYDTIAYFRSINRFRDVAFAPDGKTIFAIIDSSATTSGPTSGNPIISACRGCVQKYTFLGYNDVAGTSTIPSYIPIATGKPDICENANTVTINAASNNNNLWVPITDTNSNVVAEINANGNDLGDVTTELYINTGAVREYGVNKVLYLDRNMTITPQTQPSSPVDIRIYLNSGEFTALKNATNSIGQPSGVNTMSDLGIFKNTDPCSVAIVNAPTGVPVTFRATQGSSGYVLQGSISSFSSFYIMNTSAALPLSLLSFTGQLVNSAALLQWVTEDERGTKTFTIQRSANGLVFDSIGTVAAVNNTSSYTYRYTDNAITALSVPVVYYRLKITDADGKYTYSGIVKINLSSTRGNISVHPNPVVNDVTVAITAMADEHANWELTDIAGRKVMEHGITLQKGENTITIKLGHLPAGVYYLKVYGNTVNRGIKIQKL